MIDIRQLTVSYVNQESFVFKIDHLLVRKGECVVICGKSGSGKTTFLRLLNGLIPEYYPALVHGEATVNGQNILDKNIEELSFEVGTVFQNPSTQFFHQNVEEELIYPCENQGIDRAAIHTRLLSVTELLNLSQDLSRELLTLSGGKRQKVAIATALMQLPQVVLLDEPSANLDEEGISQLQEAIEQIKKLGMTIIISEHRLHFLEQLADRFLYFEKGALTMQWTRQELLELDRKRRQSLGLRSRTLAFEKKEMVAKKSKVRVDLNKPGLSVEALSIGYKQPIVQLEKATFPRNQVTGIIGKNGIGKTTLLVTLAGIVSPIKGSIYLDGCLIKAKKRQRQTALVMQDTRLQLVTATVKKEIQLGHKQDILPLCRQLEIETLLERHPLTLSGGQQQRVMIAHALLSQKEVYLFDEPTSGLDYLQMREVCHLLQQLAQQDKVVIVVSHDEELLAHCCDSILEIAQ